MDTTDERKQERPRVALARPVLRLLESGGEVLQQRFFLRVGESVLGRDVKEEDGIALRSDRRVSQRHAVLSCRRQAGPRTFTIEIKDSGSKNGTYVNGRRISRAELHDNDLLRLGDSLLLLRHESEQQEDAELPGFLGTSPFMRGIRTQLRRLAPSRASVLIFGESGTGKEACGRALHEASGRSGRLVSLNCGVLTGETVYSQLFGHRRGSFTDAVCDQAGAFVQADGGTLFLDEVGELPLPVQPMFLRALEEGSVLPLGAPRAVPVNVRVVCATNRDLALAVQSGDFRQDLYHRLAPASLRLVPLRERREDILELYLLAGAREMGRPLQERERASLLEADLAEALLLHPLPGNVRTLASVVVRLLIQGLDPEQETKRMLEEAREPEAATEPLPISRAVLESALAEQRGIVRRVAQVLGRSHRQIGRLLEKYELDPAQYRGAEATDDAETVAADGNPDRSR